MKKGCLIFVLVVLLLIAGGIAGGVWYLRQAVGLSQAPVVTYDRLVDADTRLIAVLETKQLGNLYTRHIVPIIDRLQLPGFLKNRIRGVVEGALPSQIALLGKTDPTSSEYKLQLFINERYLGPLVAAVTTDPKSLPAEANFHYTGPPFSLPERGVLTAQKPFPLLPGLDRFIEQQWQSGADVSPIRPAGGHLLEVVFDNRTGDALQLLGAHTALQGKTISEFFKNPEQEMGVPKLLALASDGRLTVDLSETNAIDAHLLISQSDPAASPLEVTASASVHGAFLDGLIEQFDARQTVDGNLLPQALVSNLGKFNFDITFDNGSGDFLKLIEGLGVIRLLEEQGTKVRQHLEAFNDMTVNSRLTGAMLDNGDLALEWRVDSKPGLEGAVYIALGFMPIDQTLIPMIEDKLSLCGMRYVGGPPTTKEGVAYLRQATVVGFRSNLLNFLEPVEQGGQP